MGRDAILKWQSRAHSSTPNELHRLSQRSRAIWASKGSSHRSPEALAAPYSRRSSAQSRTSCCLTGNWMMYLSRIS